MLILVLLHLGNIDLEKTNKEINDLRTEVVHWKTQAETAVTDVQREKKVKILT